MLGLVCTVPMPRVPHLGFLICSIVLTSGDDWPRHCPHTGALRTRPVNTPQPFSFMLPSCRLEAVHRSSCGAPALTLNDGDWRACLGQAQDLHQSPAPSGPPKAWCLAALCCVKLMQAVISPRQRSGSSFISSPLITWGSLAFDNAGSETPPTCWDS